ncbi:MAG: zinc ribbon-containing protein [Chromatiales bacterium]|nr:zinc ribbon-containing protein [Chromatiales bacterium]
MSENHKPEHLESGYDRMMDRVHQAIKRAGSSASGLHEHLDEAREKAVTLGELTREEADKVADYLRRDLHEVGKFLSGGSELSQWLRFDLEQIEERLWDVFSRVADQTQVEWELFRHAIEAPDSEPLFYRTSEVTGPGTLECVACHKLVHFHRISHIPPCPECHKTAFRRVSDDRCATDHHTH